MPTVISIDWDFFFYNPLELHPEDPDRPNHFVGVSGGKKIDIGLRSLMDWGASESHSEVLQDMIWNARLSAFFSVGIDPRDHIGMIPGKVTFPAEFVRHIKNNFIGLESARTLYADSHAMAAYVMADVRYRTDRHFEEDEHELRDLTVVHFDTHHDMGYDTELVRREQKQGVSDCASWLWHALDQGHVDRVIFVQPDWLKKTAWTRVIEGLEENYAHVREILDRVVPMSWSEWVKNPIGTKKTFERIPHTVFICRSGAWVPPWLDPEFDHFVHNFGQDPIKMDRAYCEERHIELAGADISYQRTCDWDAWKDHGRMLERMRQGNLEEFIEASRATDVVEAKAQEMTTEGIHGEPIRNGTNE